MSARRQGGLLMLTFAAILGILFVRGYLSGWIARFTAAVAAPPAKQPFNVPGTPTGGGAARLTSAPGTAPASTGQIA